jgi:hypothetical protein
MVENNRNRILAGMLTALGAVLAFFGVRWVVRRVQRRAQDQQYQLRAHQHMPTGAEREQAIPRYQPQDQPDRQPIPTTGAGMSQPITADLAEEMVEEQGGVDLDQSADSLVQYLLTFNDFITVVRERRRQGSKGALSLTTSDRSYFAEALDRLAPGLEGYAEGNVEENSLQDRIYRLTVKVRDALQNLEYSDDDLFRINGEVRSEVCRLLRDIEQARPNTIEDFDRVREDYDC